MGDVTKIEWADKTFNPWIGCQKVSPGCDHCYAEGLSKRYGWVEWGPHGVRKRTSEANWRKPLAWNRAAAKAGERHRVFCASLADVFDNQVPMQWRAELWALIEDTSNLDWLLLTKRPQNIAKMLPKFFPNVWLGTTVENQEEANRRIPHLLRVPAAVHFLSCEPLLGPLNLGLSDPCDHVRQRCEDIGCWNALDWVICGGESGGNARMMDPQWARDLRDQCRSMYSRTAFFMKQMTRKALIPADLLVREFPVRRIA